MVAPVSTDTGRYALASALDVGLGDPSDESNPMGFAGMVGRDAVEAFPVRLASRLSPDLGMCFVATADGGTMSSVDESLMRVRIAARRDATVVPATMSSITAALCVLLAGSVEQRARLLDLLGRGRPVAFALGEAEHGSDLAANSCELLSSPNGQLRLFGDKWLVGLGERCEAALVIARARGRGPSAFTAVLVDRDRLAASRTAGLQRPSGLRGIDFAALRFDTDLDRSAVVGPAGRAVDVATRALQVVRVFAAGTQLGCADTGLRLTMDFARRHRVSGRQVTSFPAVRRELATAAATMFGCDVVALAAARLLHVLPEQASLTSSVAKEVLGEGSAEIFTRCAGVLGARGLLRDGRYAAFEVARRDSAAAGFVDTSPVANLRLLAPQLTQWASGVSQLPSPITVTPSVATAFGLDAELPPLRLQALEPSARGRDAVTAALPFVVASARAALGGDRGRDNGAQVERTMLRLSALEMALGGLRREVLRAKQRLGAAFAGSIEQLDLTERFCRLHAAASCVHLWWFNRGRSLFGAEPGSTGWLCAALFLLLDRADASHGRLDAADTEAAFTVLARQHGRGHLFSAATVPLAESVNRRHLP